MSDPANKLEKFGALQEMPMQLRIVVGSCQRPARSLGSLTPGAVLSLDDGNSDQIRIYIGDVPFARGELIMTDGIPAIRITEIGGTDQRN